MRRGASTGRIPVRPVHEGVIFDVRSGGVWAETWDLEGGRSELDVDKDSHSVRTGGGDSDRVDGCRRLFSSYTDANGPIEGETGPGLRVPEHPVGEGNHRPRLTKRTGWM